MITDKGAERISNMSYGRGYRRCLELILKNGAVCILIASGAFKDEDLANDLRGLLRKQLERTLPGAVEGFDSMEGEPII